MPWFVNGEQVDDNEVREEIRMMRPQYEASVTDMDPIEAEMQLKEWGRENVIERMLLRQTASAAGQEVQTLVESVTSAVKAPGDKTIAEFYKKNREAFRTPEVCWAKHIVKNVEEPEKEADARAEIEMALAELQAGAPFEEVADKYSDCAGNGGELGWFPRGEMVEEFEQQVFDLPIGNMTGIFRSAFGFHIAKVYGRKPAGVRPLADVKDEIIEMLSGERKQKAIEDYLDQLRAGADIRQTKAVVTP